MRSTVSDVAADLVLTTTPPDALLLATTLDEKVECDGVDELFETPRNNEKESARTRNVTQSDKEITTYLNFVEEASSELLESGVLDGAEAAQEMIEAP